MSLFEQWEGDVGGGYPRDASPTKGPDLGVGTSLYTPKVRNGMMTMMIPMIMMMIVMIAV